MSLTAAIALLVGYCAGVTFFILAACRLAGRADDAADNHADQIAHGDVAHLPIGMTPKALTNEGRK